MAMIEKRKGKDGKISYRAKVRVKGKPSQSKTFVRLTDAKRWAAKTEAGIRDGIHFPGLEAQKHTFSDLVERYIAEVLGHKTLQMVKRYSHLADSHTSEVVAKMNEKVFSSISSK